MLYYITIVQLTIIEGSREVGGVQILSGTGVLRFVVVFARAAVGRLTNFESFWRRVFNEYSLNVRLLKCSCSMIV